MVIVRYTNTLTYLLTYIAAVVLRLLLDASKQGDDECLPHDSPAFSRFQQRQQRCNEDDVALLLLWRPHCSSSSSRDSGSGSSSSSVVCACGLYLPESVAVLHRCQ